MAESWVKNLFLTLMGAFAALIMYYVMFGQMNTGDGRGLFNAQPSNEKWQGAIFFAANAMQGPIGMYYYDHCYLPSMLDYRYLDTLLGYDTTFENYKQTDLSSNAGGANDVQRVPAEGHPASNSKSVYWYTTGWE